MDSVWRALIYVDLDGNELLNCSSLINIKPEIDVKSECIEEHTTPHSTTVLLNTELTEFFTTELEDATTATQNDPTDMATETLTNDVTSLSPIPSEGVKLWGILLGLFGFVLLGGGVFGSVFCVKLYRKRQSTIAWERFRNANPIYRMTTATNHNAIYPGESEM
jgi:hypothetical protein